MSQRLQLRVFSVSVFLLLVWMAANISSATRISNCDNTKVVTYFERRDSPYIKCYGSGDNTSTITWTLLDYRGISKHLATCHGLRNCTTEYHSSLLTVYWPSAAYSYIYLISIDREFYGTVTCTETTKTSVDSASCTLKVLQTKFRDCPDGEAAKESGSAYFYCDHSWHTPSVVKWTLNTNAGAVLDLGSCSNTSSCTSPQGSNTELTPYRGYSRLYFTSALFQRSNAGQLSCSFAYNSTTDVDTCNLEIYHAALLDNCSSEVIRGTWSFLVSCDVTQFWSSKGRYEFRVLEYFSVRKGEELFPVNTYTFPGRRSFRGSLSLYTDPADNKQYYRGRLTHSWPVRSVPGTYMGFALVTFPNDESNYYRYHYYGNLYPYPHEQSTYFNQNLNITLPSEPRHNCTALTDMRDAIVVPCVCSTDYLGSPAGRLVWLLGDTVMATGDYGDSELKLPSEKVVKGHNGMTARCQLDWVKPLTVSLPFVLNVSVTANPIAASSDEGMMGVAVAGCTLLAVVIVVAVVVAVVISRRRKYGIGCCGESLYDRPNRDTDEDNGGYSDFNVNQQTRAASNEGGESLYDRPNGDTDEDNGGYSNFYVNQQTRAASNEGDQSGVTDRVYQNLAMGQTEGHI